MNKTVWKVWNVHKDLNLDDFRKSQNVLFLYSTLDGISSDTTHNSTISISIDKNWSAYKFYKAVFGKLAL